MKEEEMNIVIDEDGNEVEEVREPAKNPDLRVVADLYYQMQKARIAMGARRSAIERGVDTGNADWLGMWEDRLNNIEVELVKDMARLLKDTTAWEWLSTVKGIGPTLACKIIALIDDIGKFDNISKLWSFSGYGLYPNQEGVMSIQKLTKGEKATFNRRLKTVFYLAGSSFLKSRSKFSDLYYNARQHYDVTHPEWTDGHKHNAAMRKMIKVFIACLWLSWRQAEGLPIRDPWIIEYGKESGHTTYYKPEDFAEKIK